jgi:hypothetical protein
MKVKINGIWYDAEKTIIQVRLNDSDKINIANMPIKACDYICFPDWIKPENVDKILSGETPNNLKDSLEYFVESLRNITYKSRQEKKEFFKESIEKVAVTISNLEVNGQTYIEILEILKKNNEKAFNSIVNPPKFPGRE